MITSRRADIFPLKEARDLVTKFMTPNPVIYWLDFLVSAGLGWGAFFAALQSPAFSPWQIAALAVSALALYRAAIFTHELAHLKKGTFKLFRLVWNATCGLPLMVPSFTYHGVHNDHHTRDVYGTKRDGEYLPFGAGKPYKIVTYVFLAPILPLFFAARFLILAPLSWVNKTVSEAVWRRASSLTIDLAYQRPGPAKRDDKTWRVQEFFAFLYGWVAVALVALGVMPVTVLVLWYFVSFFIFFLNSFRTLAAHSYRNPGGQAMSVAAQYLDSVDVPGNNALTPLWAPVGLRYHATHHLFPRLPYHNLGKAHRHLAENLADSTLYLKAVRKSLWQALARLWGDAHLSQEREL